MATGLFQPIRPWNIEDIETGLLPMPYVQESASLAAKAGAPCIYDSNRQLAECGTSPLVVGFILVDPGSNSSSAGTVCQAWRITPDFIFEITLNEAWALNLSGNSYGLVKDGTTGIWYVSTADSGNQVRIIGAPATTAIGDTKSRVLVVFNLNSIQYYNALIASGSPVSATVTAHSGGGQTSATALTSLLNRVSVSAALGDSVRLPASAVGSIVYIDNRGANPIGVFGAGTETINSIATGTGVTQGVNTVVAYYCAVVGNWETSYRETADVTSLVALTTNGAIDPHTPATYLITKAGILADTLAAPTATTDDGKIIRIINVTANAHTITATGLYQSGAAAVNLATFSGSAGGSLTLMAYNAKWVVINTVGVTMS